MVLKTKELKLKDSSGKEYKVTIREINWIKRARIGDKVTSMNQFGKPQVKIGEYKIQLLLEGIKEAPFDVNEKSLGEVEPKLLDEIYTELIDLNALSDKKKIPSGE